MHQRFWICTPLFLEQQGLAFDAPRWALDEYQTHQGAAAGDSKAQAEIRGAETIDGRLSATLSTARHPGARSSGVRQLEPEIG